MNLVEISGSREVVMALNHIDGLMLSRRSVKPLEDNQFSVSGYASDAAIDVVRARGATVTVTTSSADWEREMAEIYKNVEGYQTGNT